MDCGKPSFEYGPVKQYCDEMTVEGKLIQPEAVTRGGGKGVGALTFAFKGGGWNPYQKWGL